MQQISLYYREGASDKEYHAQIVPQGDGFVVNFQYGRRGSTLTTGTKTKAPVDAAKAEKIFNKLVTEKKAKGYTEGEAGTPYVGGDKEERKTGLAVQLLNPIEDSELEEFFHNPLWVLQEKFDGKRMLLRFTQDLGPKAINRSGLVCGAPEKVLEALETTILARGGYETIIDGEAIGDEFIAFDLLMRDGTDLRGDGYFIRHAALLEIQFRGPIRVAPIVVGETGKRTAFQQFSKNGHEGVVFKDKYAWYSPGRPNSGGTQRKFKFKASATVQVSGHTEDKRSIAVQVWSDAEGSEQIAVGNVTIPPNHEIPEFGKFIEVEYLYCYRGGCLFQPVYKGVRDDKTAPDLLSSLKFKGEAQAQAA